MIFDFLITLGIVVLSIACIMEFLKEAIEWIGNKIKKRKVNVPSNVWRVLASAFSITGVLLARNIFISVEEVSGLTAILVNKWMMIMWLPLVWWAQLQVDMKFVREHIVPMLKKALTNKLGAR